jgi:hypothetical protein
VRDPFIQKWAERLHTPPLDLNEWYDWIEQFEAEAIARESRLALERGRRMLYEVATTVPSTEEGRPPKELEQSSPEDTFVCGLTDPDELS